MCPFSSFCAFSDVRDGEQPILEGTGTRLPHGEGHSRFCLRRCSLHDFDTSFTYSENRSKWNGFIQRRRTGDSRLWNAEALPCVEGIMHSATVWGRLWCSPPDGAQFAVVALYSITVFVAATITPLAFILIQFLPFRMSSFLCSSCGRTVKYSKGSEENARENHKKNWYGFHALYPLVHPFPMQITMTACSSADYSWNHREPLFATPFTPYS